MHTTVISGGGGDGDWVEARREPESPSSGVGRHVPLEENPFDGLPTAMEEKAVPASLASAFNLIKETTIDKITYRYRVLTFIDSLSFGTNPFLAEALVNMGNGKEDAVEDFVSNLSQRDPAELDEMVAETKLHRDRVLLHSVIDMRSGEDSMDITDAIIASMQDGVKERLYDLVLGEEGAAETKAVRRFSGNNGQDASRNGVPSVNEVQ